MLKIRNSGFKGVVLVLVVVLTRHTGCDAQAQQLAPVLPVAVSQVIPAVVSNLLPSVNGSIFAGAGGERDGVQLEYGTTPPEVEQKAVVASTEVENNPTEPPQASSKSSKSSKSSGNYSSSGDGQDDKHDKTDSSDSHGDQLGDAHSEQPPAQDSPVTLKTTQPPGSTSDSSSGSGSSGGSGTVGLSSLLGGASAIAGAVRNATEPLATNISGALSAAAAAVAQQGVTAPSPSQVEYAYAYAPLMGSILSAVSGSSGGPDAAAAMAAAAAPMPSAPDKAPAPAADGRLGMSGPMAAAMAPATMEGDDAGTRLVFVWHMSNISDFGSLSANWNDKKLRDLITSAGVLDSVELATTANLSVAVRFSGADLSSNETATVAGLTSFFSELCRLSSNAFDPFSIAVSPTPGRTGGGGGSGGGGSLVLNQMPVVLGSGRRLLAGEARSGGRDKRGGGGAWASDSDGVAYGTYFGLQPQFALWLSALLEQNCGIAKVGENLPANCTAVAQSALEAAGVPISASASFEVSWVEPRTITIDVGAIVHFTKDQANANMPDRLESWISDWRNVRLLLSQTGLDLSGVSLDWVVAPTVINPGGAPKFRNLALVIGLAVSLGVCFPALVAALVVMLVKHRRRRREVAGSSDGGGSEASKRKRAKAAAPPGKRRYMAPALLPAAPDGAHLRIEEMAAANLRGAAATTSASGGGASTSAGGAAPATGEGQEEDFSGSEADLRPRLRSLGDSVTSAVRFELEVHEGEDGGSVHSDAEAEPERQQRDQQQQQQRQVPLSGAASAEQDAPPLVSRRLTASSQGSAGAAASGPGTIPLGLSISRPRESSGAAPWPGPVEAAPVVSGPPVVMGAANPPRVGALPSPFGNYDFGDILSGGGAAGGDSGGGAAFEEPCVGSTVITIQPDGSWIAPPPRQG